MLAAQAFTSLIPFLVVAAAFGPGEGDLADKIDDAFNLSGSAERSMRALFNSAGETESAVTWVSIIILILSTTSFARAMQRMFERSYEVEKAPLREAWWSLVWLAAFAAWIVIAGPLRETFREAGIVLAIGRLDGHRLRALARNADDPAPRSDRVAPARARRRSCRGCSPRSRPWRRGSTSRSS